MLQPGNSRAVFGFLTSTYRMYWAVCHNANVGDDEVEQLSKKLDTGFHSLTHVCRKNEML